MGVTKLLDVQELLDGNADERSIALYTTLLLSAYKTKEKMLALQNEMGNKQQELSIESKSKEEITKLNSDLEMQATTLRKNLADEEEHSKSLDELCDEIKKEINTNNSELEKLHKEYDELQAAYDALSAQNDEELEAKLKAEREDRATKEAELKALLDEIEELEKEHAKLRAELDAIA